MTRPITYLDNNATTRVDDRALAAMLPHFCEQYGNPSSTHQFGAQVGARIENARSSVAKLIGAREPEIVFTSGGTEADNAALRGVFAARPGKRHLIISTVEHHAIIDLAEQFEREGVEVSRIGVDGEGRLDLDALTAAIRQDTALISIMLANNETGVVLPLPQVCEIAAQHSIPVHTDAVQAIGKIPVNVKDLGVQLLSLSAHKFHGPKGAGALYIRGGTPFRPHMIGGPQERHRRGGTLNAAGIIGLAAACEILSEPDGPQTDRIRTMRDRLEAELLRRFPDAKVMSAAAERVPNTACVCFPGVEAEAVLLLLSEAGICASSGAACSSGSLEPSHVLRAMGIDPRIAQGQLRLSLGRFNRDHDVDRLLETLPPIIEKVAAVNV